MEDVRTEKGAGCLAYLVNTTGDIPVPTPFLTMDRIYAYDYAKYSESKGILFNSGNLNIPPTFSITNSVLSTVNGAISHIEVSRFRVMTVSNVDMVGGDKGIIAPYSYDYAAVYITQLRTVGLLNFVLDVNIGRSGPLYLNQSTFNCLSSGSSHAMRLSNARMFHIWLLVIRRLCSS